MIPFERAVTFSDSLAGKITSVKYKVHGFWSNDYIRLTHRDWEGGGSIDFQWSSGGRDYTEERDDAVAAECFGLAILNACEFAADYRSSNDK